MRALVCDLDGTLVDTVCAHVLAWQRALEEAALPIEGWRIYRRIGTSGGLFGRAVAREIGRPLRPDEAERRRDRHGQLFRALLPRRRPLPGARELLATLRRAAFPSPLRRPAVDRRSTLRSRCSGAMPRPRRSRLAGRRHYASQSTRASGARVETEGAWREKARAKAIAEQATGARHPERVRCTRLQASTSTTTG